MKGTIFDIKHFAIHDGPGIRQTVFLKGCPLNCWWCHNPESQDPKPENYIKVNKLDGKEFKKEKTVGYEIELDDLYQTIDKDRVFFDESNGGVTFSGGEPFMQAEFLFEITKECRNGGIHTSIDTTGFTSKKNLEKLATIADLFLYDLKIIDSERHKKYAGVPTETIIENLKWLDQKNKNVILRFPVIPNITNTKENIKEIKAFISTLENIRKIDILPFHNISKGKYDRFNKAYKMGETSTIPDREMDELKKEFEELDFEVKIGG